MEISVVCPFDGRVHVDMDRVTTIVLYGLRTVDVVFTCPVCGREILVSLESPTPLVTASELAHLVESTSRTVPETDWSPFGFPGEDDLRPVYEEETHVRAIAEALGDGQIDDHCDRFRARLSQIETADDFLAASGGL